MIDVAFTAADVSDCDVAVVIDVLRATSTIAQALASGYERVLCVGSVEEALAMAGPGNILAGERNCVMPAGFDCDNSPRAMLERRGEQLILTTSNGTAAIAAAAGKARVVVLASLLNLTAVINEIERLVDSDAASIQMVCAGGWGRPCVEDTYVAGLLVRALGGVRSDSASIAAALAGHYPTAGQALRSAAHASVMRDRGLDADLALCARTSMLESVPMVTDWLDDVATVVDAVRVAEGMVSAP